MPPTSGEHLYQQYIATKAEININQLRANVEVLLGEISSSMTDTLSDTSSFADIIDKSFKELERVEQDNLSIEEVMTVIRQLVSESKDIRHSTNFLNNQLNAATQEISLLKEQLAKVQKDALFDSLSGLYNRRAFDGDMLRLIHAGRPSV